MTSVSIQVPQPSSLKLSKYFWTSQDCSESLASWELKKCPKGPKIPKTQKFRCFHAHLAYFWMPRVVFQCISKSWKFSQKSPKSGQKRYPFLTFNHFFGSSLVHSGVWSWYCCNVRNINKNLSCWVAAFSGLFGDYNDLWALISWFVWVDKVHMLKWFFLKKIPLTIKISF